MNVLGDLLRDAKAKGWDRGVDQADSLARKYRQAAEINAAVNEGRDTVESLPAGRPCRELRRGYTLAIIEMSDVLTQAEKRLYRRFVELDRPKAGKVGGCFAAVSKLGKRLAMHPDVVTRTRRALHRYGLLAQSPEGTSPVRWFPRLPDRVHDVPPATIRAGRATDMWLAMEAHELDLYLRPLADAEKAARKRQTKSRVEQDELSGSNRQKVGGERTNCLARVPRFMPLRSRNAMAA